MPWEVEFRNGVWLPQVEWWLDAHFPVDRSFVSHAHFDHIAAHRELLCSSGTARLLRARLPMERTEHVLPFGHTEALTENCSVTLYPAGHIFGSAQSLLRHEEHGTLLYTGDFKLRAGLSAEPCATPPADVLIMETTYGRPHYVFPPTAEVLAAIGRFCHEAIEHGEIPVLFGYSLGKSQELLRGLTAAGLPVMLHPQTLRLTRIYEEFGMSFPPYRAFAADAAKGHVVICPPQTAASSFLRQISPRRTAVITGWAIDGATVYRYQCDAAFPMSDHADYPDLLAFVERVNPRRVLTLHGFAAEFARTLRDKGIEAWAIGEDNQLEFGLADRAAPRPTVPPPAAEVPPPDVDAPPDLFSTFAAVARAVADTPRKLEKIALLSHYFQSLPDPAAAQAALFLTGRAFPQSDARTLQMGWSVLKRAVLGITAVNESDVRAAYQRFADSGDTLEALLEGRTRPQPVTLGEIATFFAALAAARGPAAKLELLQARFSELSGPEAKYLVKIITGDLRIGLKEGLVEEAVAAAAAARATAAGRDPVPTEAVREANMLSGDIAAVTRAALAGTLAGIELKVFHPLQFMLASPEPTAAAIIERLGAPVWLEEKYDGIRCQLHRQGERVELYSRDLHRITAQFPDLARSALGLRGDCILDGELLAWRNGRALAFAELQKRLGRKPGNDFFLGDEIPVSFSAYDILWLNGDVLLSSPLADRRRRLEALLSGSAAGANAEPAVRLAPVKTAHSAVEIEAAFLQARARGNEGLMAKDPRSPYTPGRRGLAWLKLKKAYATLDVVVVGVEYGHGKRRDVLSDYTFAVLDPEHDRLLTVGKAYSGLTDLEIAQFTQHFLDHTLEVHGRYRAVVPDVVLEVAFDSIHPSARHQSGYALRFPRIVRIRTDKTVREIDTLETCRVLASGTLHASPHPIHTPALSEAGLLATLHPDLSAWFVRRFGRFAPAQLLAIPEILGRRSLLLSSPTGSGKTLAAFLGVFDAIARRHFAGEPPAGIAAIYVSPLRALAYDLQKNLHEPLHELGWSGWLTIGARTGDTTAAERAKQKRRPPHILVTTPETLTLLLSQPAWVPALAPARFLIIDELHALAENKRGSLLMAAAERLQDLQPEPLVRIGLSATVAPLTDMAIYLAGPGRACGIAEVTERKAARIEVFSPLRSNAYPPAGYTATRVLRELGALLATKQTTLIFTNTRSGAESIGLRLKALLPRLAEQIEVHHASLDRAVRLAVEDKLKRGELRAVVCSTSLEMGIDIGAIDTVVMVSAPKGVARALQRLGRSGHAMNRTSHGILVASNINDLAECTVTARMMERKQLEPVQFPSNPADVLAQHLVGLAVYGSVTPDEAYALFRRSHPFQTLPRDLFDRVLHYLAGGGSALERHYGEIFGKVRVDERGLLVLTAPRIARDLYQNVGTINTESMVAVRLGRRPLGQVEESFMKGLRKGDVFVLNGRPVRLVEAQLLTAKVERADGAVPTIPRWYANKMPLASGLAAEVVKLRGALASRLPQGRAAAGPEIAAVSAWLASEYHLSSGNAAALVSHFALQAQISAIPTADFLLIERYPERGLVHYFFHILIGRSANDALSRIVAQRVHARKGGNALVTIDDYGFQLTLRPFQDAALEEWKEIFSVSGAEAAMRAALAEASLVKWHFRGIAQTGLMVPRRVRGAERKPRALQWSSEIIFNVLRQREPEHPLLAEAYAEATQRFLDLPRALAFLSTAANVPWMMRDLDRVSPFSFGIYASTIKETMTLEDPETTIERLYHEMYGNLTAAASRADSE